MKEWTGIIAGMLLAACNSDKGVEPRPSPQAEGGVGRIYLAGGDPAPGARVRFYTVDHVPQNAGSAKVSAVVHETLTDSAGRYTIDSLPPGEYNILSELDGKYGYADSVVVGSLRSFLPDDTLREAASVTGAVRLQPNHSPRTATVQVLGTNVR